MTLITISITIPEGFLQKLFLTRLPKEERIFGKSDNCTGYMKQITLKACCLSELQDGSMW